MYAGCQNFNPGVSAVFPPNFIPAVFKASIKRDYAPAFGAVDFIHSVGRARASAPAFFLE